MRYFLAALCATALSVLALPPAFARPIVPAEKRIIPWHAQLPACEDPAVLDRLASRFAEKESTYWHSGLQVVTFDRIGPYGFRSNGRDYIPRRYCTARVLMNNDKHYWATYTIGEELGIIGFGFGLHDYSFGLEWCIAGLDRNWAYGPGCEAVRPVAQQLRRGELSKYRLSPVGAAPVSQLPRPTPLKPLAPPVLPPSTPPAAPAPKPLTPPPPPAPTP